MSPSYNGWSDDAEDEREALAEFEAGELGKLDEYEGWPEDMSGPEYWLNRRATEEGQ